jgi:MFS family permease
MSKTHLLQSPRFAPIFWTQFFGALNDNLLKNSLVLLITFHSVNVFGLPPAQMVPIAGAIFILPYFLFSAMAGQLADQSEKSRLVQIIKLIEIGIMVLAIVGFVSHHFEFLLLVLFLMGLHSTFFGPIKFSILPQHLEPNQLVAANALVEAGTFLAILLGTLLAGLLIDQTQSEYWISGALMLVAVLGWVVSRKIPEAPAVASSEPIPLRIWGPTLEVIRSARNTPVVYFSILGISWFWLFGASVLSLLPSYTKDVLLGKPEVATFFLALFSVGIGVGSILCERLSRGNVELRLTALGSMGITFFTAGLWLLGPPTFGDPATLTPLGVRDLLTKGSGVQISILFFALSLCSGLYIVPLYTLMQERSPIQIRSRIIGANNILNALYMVIGAGLLVGLIALGLSIPQIFGVLAGLNLAALGYLILRMPELKQRLLG